MTIRVALVTGAARRVGADIARKLHVSGMNVIVHCNQSLREANALCAELNAQRSDSARVLQADLSNTSACQTLIAAAIHSFGRLDVLINNASRFYKTPIGTVDENAWNDLLDSNLKAPFFLAQAAVSELKKHEGCIVNIGDVHAERPMESYSVYCIAKAGLLMLTRALAKELGPHIRVNAVCPGTVMLPEGENSLNGETLEKILNKITLHRYGTADDIAKAVNFLVFDADYMTGQMITVDGGRSLSI